MMQKHADTRKFEGAADDSQGEQHIVLGKLEGFLRLDERTPTERPAKKRGVVEAAVAEGPPSSLAQSSIVSGAFATLTAPFVVMSPVAAGANGDVLHAGGPMSDSAALTLVGDVHMGAREAGGSDASALEVLIIWRLALELLFHSVEFQALQQMAQATLPSQPLSAACVDPTVCVLMQWHDKLASSKGKWKVAANGRTRSQVLQGKAGIWKVAANGRTRSQTRQVTKDGRSPYEVAAHRISPALMGADGVSMVIVKRKGASQP